MERSTCLIWALVFAGTLAFFAAVFAGCGPANKSHAARVSLLPYPYPSPTPWPRTSQAALLPRLPRPAYLPTIRLDFLTCGRCHFSGGSGMGRFSFSSPNLIDDPADYSTILSQVSLAVPADSRVILKASGQLTHTGGVLWPIGSPAYVRVLDWIAQGASYR